MGCIPPCAVFRSRCPLLGGFVVDASARGAYTNDLNRVNRILLVVIALRTRNRVMVRAADAEVPLLVDRAFEQDEINHGCNLMLVFGWLSRHSGVDAVEECVTCGMLRHGLALLPRLTVSAGLSRFRLHFKAEQFAVHAPLGLLHLGALLFLTYAHG
jgi:hypothetical protein